MHVLHIYIYTYICVSEAIFNASSILSHFIRFKILGRNNGDEPPSAALSEDTCHVFRRAPAGTGVPAGASGERMPTDGRSSRVASPTQGLTLDFVVSKTIPASIYRDGKPDLPDFGAIAETEAAAGELLEIELKVDAPRSCSWSIDRRHILVAGSSFTSLLVRLREEFDGRRAGPGARMEAAMEAPTTAAEWRAYVELWLFGPPEPKQATLHRWLRPRA